MSPLRSLQSRIFLASALLTVLSIGVAIYLVGVRVNREVEAGLQRDIVSTGALVDQLRTTRAETFAMMVRLVGDAPKLKAAVVAEATKPRSATRRRSISERCVLIGVVLFGAPAQERPDAVRAIDEHHRPHDHPHRPAVLDHERV